MTVKYCLPVPVGATENAGVENAGASKWRGGNRGSGKRGTKVQRWRSWEWKLWQQKAATGKRGRNEYGKPKFPFCDIFAESIIGFVCPSGLQQPTELMWFRRRYAGNVSHFLRLSSVVVGSVNQTTAGEQYIPVSTVLEPVLASIVW